MSTHAAKTHEQQAQSHTSESIYNTPSGDQAIPTIAQHPEAVTQRKLQEAANNGIQIQKLTQLKAIATPITGSSVQRKENRTGIPDNLKSGIENLSGFAMDDVKVHYNSAKPAQLNAHAYAQGTDIHMAPGQEKHLPHEAWHVVQQKQGRVKPTMQLKEQVHINDDEGLEHEADLMGMKALQMRAVVTPGTFRNETIAPPGSIVQRMLMVDNKNIKRSVVEAAIRTGAKQGEIPETYYSVRHNKVSLTAQGNTAVTTLMTAYSTVKLKLTDFTSLIHQVGQDLHMLQGNNPQLVGVGHQNSEFRYKLNIGDRSKKDLDFKSGITESNQRVYRTMTQTDWDNNYLAGHGGSIGQAMHYFNLGKTAQTQTPGRTPDMLVEFTFHDQKLGDLLDGIEGGHEGKASTDEKFGGKTEQNTAFGARDNIFSVDLKNASELISGAGVTARVLASTNGVMPGETKKGRRTAWQKRPGL